MGLARVKLAMGDGKCDKNRANNSDHFTFLINFNLIQIRVMQMFVKYIAFFPPALKKVPNPMYSCITYGGEDSARKEDGLTKAPVGLHGQVGDCADASVVGLEYLDDEVLQVRVFRSCCCFKIDYLKEKIEKSAQEMPTVEALVSLQKVGPLGLQVAYDLLLVGVLEKAEDGRAEKQIQQVEYAQTEEAYRVLVESAAHWCRCCFCCSCH